MLNFIAFFEVVHANDLVSVTSSSSKNAFMVGIPSHRFDRTKKTLIIIEKRLSMIFFTETSLIKLSIEHVSDFPDCELGTPRRRGKHDARGITLTHLFMGAVC